VYGADQEFTWDAMAEAGERYDRLQRAHERAVDAVDSVRARTTVTDEDLRDAVATAREQFTAAMNDDFNSREALAALLDVAAAVNAHVDDHDSYDFRGLADAVDAIETFGGDVFGFTLGGDAGGEVAIADDLVELVLSVREEERAAGNYERADDLRDRLEALGVEVQDTDDGPTYRL
jgi:cysteinyl-tRNA synthetase